jgi:serine/threonine protein kinase
LFFQPSNVLINQQCRAKICDFGLARSLNHVYEDPQHPALTEYVGMFIQIKLKLTFATSFIL